MIDRQWRLTYPGCDFTWGANPADPFRRPMNVYNAEAPDPGSVAITLEDAERPRQDGVRFGQDYRGGRTWTFTLGVRGTSQAHARSLLAAAEKAWRGDGVRLIPGKMAALTTAIDGQERTLYGRPRQFTPSYAKIAAAEAAAVCTFDTMDDVWYGPEQSVRIDMNPTALSGGFVFPFTFPLVMAATSSEAGGVTVGGTLDAYIAAEVHGPIVNPVIFSPTAGWRLKLAASIGSLSTVTLDARPWARTILADGAASWAGKLDRGGPLSAAKLAPGPHEVGLQGTDPTGTAYLMLRWQTAHASMI